MDVLGVDVNDSDNSKAEIQVNKNLKYLSFFYGLNLLNFHSVIVMFISKVNTTKS